MKNHPIPSCQRGFSLLEALIAIVIFAIGILATISMQAVSIAAQNDSQYRVEASHLIDQLVAQMRIAVAHDGVTGNVIPASFSAFDHKTTTDGTCSFSGSASGDALVTAWVRQVKGLNPDDTPAPGKGLPGITDSGIQIITDTSMAGINQVRITVCWQAANDRAAHQHSVVAYVD